MDWKEISAEEAEKHPAYGFGGGLCCLCDCYPLEPSQPIYRVLGLGLQADAILWIRKLHDG